MEEKLTLAFNDVTNEFECEKYLHKVADRLEEICKTLRIKLYKSYNQNFIEIKKCILSKDYIKPEDYKIYFEVEEYDYQVNYLNITFGYDISKLVGRTYMEKPRRLEIVKYKAPKGITWLNTTEIERNIGSRLEQNARRRAAGLSKAYEYRAK